MWVYGCLSMYIAAIAEVKVCLCIYIGIGGDRDVSDIYLPVPSPSVGAEPRMQCHQLTQSEGNWSVTLTATARLAGLADCS